MINTPHILLLKCLPREFVWFTIFNPALCDIKYDELLSYEVTTSVSVWMLCNQFNRLQYIYINDIFVDGRKMTCEHWIWNSLELLHIMKHIQHVANKSTSVVDLNYITFTNDLVLL